MTGRQYQSARAKMDALDDIYDDLADGAYFAVMAENGIDTDLMAEMADYEIANSIEDGRFIWRELNLERGIQTGRWLKLNEEYLY